MVLLPSQGISSGWRNGLTGTPGNSASGNAKPGTQGQTTPCTCTCCGLTNRVLPVSVTGNGLGILMDTKLTMSQQCALVAKKTKSHPGCIRQNITTTLSLSSALVRYVWVVCPVLGSWVKERHEHTGAGPLKNH